VHAYGFKTCPGAGLLPDETGASATDLEYSSIRAPRVITETQAEGNMAMFKKGDDEGRRDLASPPRIGQARPVRSKNVSVIGPTLVFKGELSADEDLVIEGHIEGTIAHHKKHLTIGKEGRVKADIHASSVIVEGELVGDIHSEGIVSLANGADVKGNIYCGRIVMEDGARFKGKIDMGEPPKIEIPKEPEKPVTAQPIKPTKISA
jgi:cytoskeletal protein CcmA (bactofilin family)